MNLSTEVGGKKRTTMMRGAAVSICLLTIIFRAAEAVDGFITKAGTDDALPKTDPVEPAIHVVAAAAAAEAATTIPAGGNSAYQRRTEKTTSKVRHLMRKLTTVEELRRIFHLDDTEFPRSRRSIVQAESVGDELGSKEGNSKEKGEKKLDNSYVLTLWMVGLGCAVAFVLIVSLSLWCFFRNKSKESAEKGKNANKSRNSTNKSRRGSVHEAERGRESGRGKGGARRKYGKDDSDDYKYRKMAKAKTHQHPADSTEDDLEEGNGENSAEKKASSL